MSVELLELATNALGPLADDVVFVGGATIHLWLTEPGVPPTRATDDVDAICEVASLNEYYRLADRLRERGFTEAMDEPVICRWRHSESGLKFDLMPTEESVLGFTNPWFKLSCEMAVKRKLPSGASIRAVPPPLVLATKLAAWNGRGKSDALTSLDVHDIIVLVDGRPELIEEITAQPHSLREYISHELSELSNQPSFDYAVQSMMQSYGQLAAERAPVVDERIATISMLETA